MANIVNYVGIVSPRRADGLVADIYSQAKREIGRLVEAVTMFSPDPSLLAASWATFREPLLAAGLASRASKEAVAATVSRLNDCPYCVDAHTIMLYGSGKGAFATQLLGGVAAHDLDTEFRDLSRWAESSATAATAPADPPFAVDKAPEFVGVLVYFHFLNRVINVLLADTFLPGPDGAKNVARRVAGRMMSRTISATNEPGRAEGLADLRPLPADLAWAAPSVPIATAFGMLAEATEAAAVRAVPKETRAVVEDAVVAWDGGPVGISTAWLDEPLAGLSPFQRPAARLALLTALAPFQVTERDVLAYRADRPADQDLLGLLSWSAFAAARRIGTWAASGTTPKVDGGAN